MDCYLASDFNVFSYMTIDENHLSDIVRDLLDPHGPHGQGDTFLVEFLHRIQCSDYYQPGDSIDVKRESPTDRIERSQRRIDLLIDIQPQGPALAWYCDRKQAVGSDQENQIADYLDQLKKRLS